MNRNKGIIIIILLVLIVAFIAFVAVMQNNFMNRDFDDSIRANTIEETIPESDVETDDSDTDLTESENSLEEQNSSGQEEASEEAKFSSRTVTVDSLNVRSGPGTEYDITGVVTLNQVVEVEDDGSGWVKITTPDFTGYINDKYLSDDNE
ncbi:SH3 domain-containing protein [Oceanobacillus massiliensis]|uniref:SH3 domain-containing protein n=1 Tax=Oceanobacillus massiliensis TaxID=1465765 RepID=UPI0030198432